MAVKILHKRSAVEFKNATSGQLEFGELGLNYNESGPYLQCKDADGKVVNLGGVYLTDDTGDAPGNPLPGRLWLRGDTLFIYDGNNWVEIAGGGGGGTPGAITILGGDGVNASTVGSTVTIVADIDTTKGLDFSSGEIIVKLGSGLRFDATGAIEVDPNFIGGNANDGITTLKDADGNTVGFWSADQSTDKDVVLPDYAVKGTSDIPTVNDGKLQFLNASGDVQYEFTANQAGDTQITLDDSGGVGSATDLNVTNRTATTLDIESSTGADATVPFATDTLAGLMTAADKDKLDNIGDGAINIAGGNGITATGDNATANQATDTTRTLSVKTGDGLTIDSNGNVIIDPNYNLDGNVNLPTVGEADITLADADGNAIGVFNVNESTDDTITLPDYALKTEIPSVADLALDVYIKEDKPYYVTETIRVIATVTGGAQPVTLAYQWYMNFGLIISETEMNGETSDSLYLSDTKVGYSYRCKVTATDANNVEVVAYSEYTGAVYKEPDPVDPGVTKIIAGTGIAIDPTAGTGDVTINSTVTGLEFAGNVDVTDETTIPTVRSANELYVNIGQGTFHPDWAAITNNAEDTDTANPGDFMLLDTNTTDTDPWTWIEGGTPPSSDGTWIDDGAGNLYPATITNNVGIGTTSPSVNLEVSSALPWFRLTDSDDESACDLLNNGGKLSIRADEGKKSSSSYIDIRVQADEKMRIKSNGNVGIGTTDPNRILTIYDDTPIIRLGNDATNYCETFYQKSTGLTVFKSRVGSSNGGFSFAGTNGTGDTPFVRIDSDGNVGIGTTNPAHKLDVNGDLNATNYRIDLLQELV